MVPILGLKIQTENSSHLSNKKVIQREKLGVRP